MAKKKVERIPVFTWAFKSSTPHGGQVISYIAQLNEDNTLSCNCPGWIFSRGDKSCKHTKKIDNEAQQVWKDWKAGKKLEILDLTTGVSGATGVVSEEAKTEQKTTYGRVLEL